MPKRYIPFVLILMIAFMSACLLSTGYHKKDGTYVYATSDEGQGYVEHPLENVRPESFQILNKHGYAKDDLHVYYHENIVLGADPKSFTAMTELYGKDNAHVYYEFKTIPGADPASFTLLNIQWGKDSQDVYRQDRPLEACDPATFVFLENGWERDSQCVYRETGKLPDADPASFVVLNDWFGKDKNHVYSYIPSIIEGADPATFKIRGACVVCGEDKNGCYKNDKPVDCETLK